MLRRIKDITGNVLYTCWAATLKEALEQAVENNINLAGANFMGARLNNARFGGAKLNGARFDYAHLNYAQFNYASLNYAHFNYAYLNGANLNNTQLNYASFNVAHLIGANLNYVSLKNAFLISTHLDCARLKHACLDNAYLDGASLEGVCLDGASLKDVGAVITAAQPNGLTAFGWLRDGWLSIRIGCLEKRLDEARKYCSPSHANWEKQQEIPPVLDYIEEVAKLRGWRVKDV